MKVYRTDEIRNVVLLGHGGSGKTSLVEAMAYVSGAISRMGKVADGNTISDFDKEEQKRDFSISTTLARNTRKMLSMNLLESMNRGCTRLMREYDMTMEENATTMSMVSPENASYRGVSALYRAYPKTKAPIM